jgi:outer membrane protein
VVQQAKVGYFEVLKNQRLVQVAEETLNAQEKHLEQARAFYDVGLRPKIDVTRAEVDVARDRQNLITVRYRLQNSRVDLERILGGPPTPGPYRLAEVTERPERPPRLEPLIDEALAVRPEVLRFQAQVKAAEGQLRAAVGRNWPSIDGIGGYNYSNTEFPLENNWQVGVQMSWPIFTGFRTQGEVNEAKSLVKQAQAELERERLQVTQQVSQAYLRLGEAEESIATARVALRQAQENLDLADGRYRSGVGDAIEFSDAQVSLTRAKSDLVSASYEYLQAQAELERALGRGPRPEQLPDARETASAGQSGDVSAVTRSP